MEKYNYQCLINDLSSGREIEFLYNDKVWALLNWQEGWVFVCDNQRKSEYHENIFELLNVIKIEGETVEKVFNTGNIKDLTIY